MMKKTILSITFIISAVVGFSQNQYHISQNMMYQPFINPSVIGSYSNLNGALFYKNQWTGFEGAPEIAGFSINSSMKNSNHSVGLTLINDKIGISNIKDLSIAYSYKIKFNDKNYLTLGIAGTMILMQSNLGQLDIIQAGDPIFQSDTKTFAMPNAKFGTYYFRNNFYIGFAVPNILKNKIETSGIAAGITNFDAANIHYYLHSGYQFDINDTWKANTSILFKQVSGSPLQIGLNGQVVYKDLIGAGLSYRTSKELVAMINYRINPQLKLGYAYDYNLNQIGSYSNGTHEIIVLFELIKDNAVPIIEVPRF